MKGTISKGIIGWSAAALLIPSLSFATTLRLAENQPESNPVTVAMHKFAELTSTYSNGEVKVKVFSGAQLGQEAETIEQTQAGIIDLTRVNSVTLANVSPSVGVFTLPYIFKNIKHKYRVLDSDIGDEVRADMAKYGLVGFEFMEAGTRSFYTTEEHPVKSIEDMKGLKIRVQKSPISISMVNLVGGVATPMNYGEVFSSLQTGVIDGAENDYVSYLTSGHYEVAPNYVEDGHLSPPAILIMNKAKFDSLPENHRNAIAKAAKEAAIFERDLMIRANIEAKERVVAAGVKVTVIDNTPFQQAVQPVYEEFPKLLPLVNRIKAVK
ncbi:C4-dicarboxylate ABC transporter [Vibrio nigripulchritudo]|uniref:TRAP transporter substrate-binding protein n=1 Tax=Vibrio nigripulchritudo TaxID=28173 RepID=UPI0019097454|nr:TRAP transporter substrate-binding protein [Vibrio nigripulchritudo]BCL70222.1 C4-dicarboxylate ABC transporter [Vibrio nigripulchritudo]BDU31572.1 C4-dicarboxylate ABC transporter [Vibrio nigripulchritudo]